MAFRPVEGRFYQFKGHRIRVDGRRHRASAGSRWTTSPRRWTRPCRLPLRRRGPQALRQLRDGLYVLDEAALAWLRRAAHTTAPAGCGIGWSARSGTPRAAARRATKQKGRHRAPLRIRARRLRRFPSRRRRRRLQARRPGRGAAAGAASALGLAGGAGRWQASQRWPSARERRRAWGPAPWPPSGAAARAAEAEHADGLGHAARLLAQALGGGGGFLHQRGVLLRHLVELRDGAVDLADALALLAAAALISPMMSVTRCTLATISAIVAPASLHQLGAGLDALDAGADQALDLLGGLGAALGQRAHLAGHHREAAALFAGAGGFHRGVQRQDVGLEGDAVDGADDVGDLAASCALISSMVATTWRHDLAAALRPPRRPSWRAGWPSGGVGRLLDGAGQLLHRAGGLLQVAGRLLGALAQVQVAGGDLGAGGADAVGRAAHVADELLQRTLRAVQRGQQAADVVGAAAREWGGSGRSGPAPRRPRWRHAGRSPCRRRSSAARTGPPARRPPGCR